MYNHPVHHAPLLYALCEKNVPLKIMTNFNKHVKKKFIKYVQL